MIAKRAPRDWRGLVASVAFCELVGIVPGVLTREDATGWYRKLDRPPGTPPDWVFGPVWTTLFALMGASLHAVRRTDADGRSAAVALFLGQLALNAAWTLVFFRRRSPLGGVAVIVALWLAIVATVVAFARVDRRAAVLLVPYLLWVTFAAYLNVGIWRRNPDA